MVNHLLLDKFLFLSVVSKASHYLDFSPTFLAAVPLSFLLVSPLSFGLLSWSAPGSILGPHIVSANSHLRDFIQSPDLNPIYMPITLTLLFPEVQISISNFDMST